MKHRSWMIVMSVVAIGSGCASTDVDQRAAVDRYVLALEETDASRGMLVEAGSDQEQEAIQRFKDFYKDFSEDVVRNGVRNLYADEAYFRDSFKEVRGIDDLEHYFLESASAVHTCSFDIQEVISSGGDHYFRWVMDLVPKRYKDEPAIVVAGMTLARFDQEGKVIFHQDYFDAGAVYERLPVLGWMVGKVKKRL